jgi:hypothetical protein
MAQAPKPDKPIAPAGEIAAHATRIDGGRSVR